MKINDKSCFSVYASGVHRVHWSLWAHRAHQAYQGLPGPLGLSTGPIASGETTHQARAHSGPTSLPSMYNFFFFLKKTQ